VDLSDFRLVWERHTEFIRYTFISPAEAPRLAGQTSQGEAQRLKGLGHLAHEQDPAAVMAEIIDFLPSPPASP
ncbi:MAG: DUF3422 family protein, partial [Pseudomonadota bacterium]